MPMVSDLLESVPNAQPTIQDLDSEDPDGKLHIRTEAVMLFLPSSLLNASAHDRLINSLSLKEKQLRIAQANDALVDIRRLRRVLTGVLQFKQLNTAGTGQKYNTRVRDLYSGFQTKVRLAAERYRAAYKAISVLDPFGTWSQHLRVLHDEDIRGPGRDSDESILGEGQREMSWIWLVSNAAAQPDEAQELDNSLRIEWAHVRARALRWIEETILIPEEMRRVLAFSEWKAWWWLRQAQKRSNISPALHSGLSAYAHKQASIYRQRACHFGGQWLPLLKENGIHPDWATKFSTPVDKDKSIAVNVNDEVEM
jgi:hypothetical protein